MKNDWRAVKAINRFNQKFELMPRAHLFERRADRQWTSRCNKVAVHTLSETIPITEAHRKCKYCIPFELRRKLC